MLVKNQNFVEGPNGEGLQEVSLRFPIFAEGQDKSNTQI